MFSGWDALAPAETNCQGRGASRILGMFGDNSSREIESCRQVRFPAAAAAFPIEAESENARVFEILAT